MNREMQEGQTHDAPRQAMRGERLFSIIDRYAAWFSALLLFLFLVSGFGMTKPALVDQWTAGVITWRVAYDMHNVLYYPLIFVFTLHTFFGLRRATLRRTRSKRVATWLAVILGGIVLAFLLNLAFAPAAF